MPIASYGPYINTVIVLIVTYHIYVVISNFEKIPPRKSNSSDKAVRIQTDAVGKQSECIETCGCPD